MNAKPNFWQIVFYALKIGSLTGLISGAGFGLFFGLLFSSGGLLFFAQVLAVALLSGMLIGVVFSAVNVLIIALVTQRFFSPPTDASGYYRTIGGACILSCLLLGIGILATFHSLAGFGVIALPIIMVAAWWARQKVGDWYIGEGNASTVIEDP